jgi:hypothetical protein
MDTDTKNLVTHLLMQAEIEVLLSLTADLAASLGVTQIDGLTINDWFQREKHARVDQILIQFEDKDPSVAAFLLNLIDESRERLRKKSPPADNP